MQQFKNRNRRGFTLIEVLIVVVILGILAATVLPQFASSTANAKESALRADLSQMRAQIQLYKFQHDGVLPSGNAANVLAQLTQMTDITGALAPTGTALGAAGFYGPYLINSLPNNPYVTNGNGLLVTSGTLSPSSAVPAAGTGWVYSTTTGQVISNTSTTQMTADGTTQLSAL